MTDTVEVGAQAPPVTQVSCVEGTLARTAPAGGLALAQPPRRPARRTWAGPYLRRAVLLDSVAALVAASLAALSVGLWGNGHLSTQRLISVYGVIVLVTPVAWVGAVALSRGYERRLLGVGTDEFRALAGAAVRLLAITGLVSYASYSGRPFLSRTFVLTVFPLMLVSALVLRYALRKSLHRQRGRGRYLQRTVVVGRADSVLGLIHELRRAPVHGLEVVAACTSSLNVQSDQPSDIVGVQMLGNVQEALGAVDLVDAEVVVVSNHSEMTGPELRRLSWALEARDVELIVSPGIMEVAGPRLSIRPAAGLSLLHVERPTVGGGRLIG